MQNTIQSYGSIRFIMKVSLFVLILQLTCASLLWASRAESQVLNQKVKLELKNAGLKESLQQIETQSDAKFTYTAELLAGISKKNTISSKGISVKEALTLILANTGLQYRSLAGYIIIEAKPVPKQNGKISGQVKDAKTGETLVGVSVSVPGQQIGTTTNVNGVFTLSVAPGTYNISFSYIGYQTRLIENVKVEEAGQTKLNVTLELLGSSLSEVTVKADRVITSTNRQLISQVRQSTGVVSGISSEQITISADRSATEVVRRVAGISLQDGFISIRGMTPRYNPVFLNNAYLPSTDPNRRAFNFDLLPSNSIDRILVYKTAAPELPADFAGGVVKVYTKKALPVRRFEISINGQYRTGNMFFGNHSTTPQGKYDWLGYDDGSRQIPANIPRDQYGQIQLPYTNTGANNTYTRSNEVITQALAARSAKIWNIGQVRHNGDILADLSYYNYADIGKARLNTATIGRYEHQRTYYKSGNAQRANTFVEKDFPADGSPLTPFYDGGYRLSYDSVYQENVRIALMEQLSLTINKNHDINFMGLFNRNTKDALQINTLQEFKADNRGSNFYPRRFESAYNNQDLLLGQLGGNHKIDDGAHTIEWNATYSRAKVNDPNQFSNVFEADDTTIGNYFEVGADKLGKVTITDQTTWRLSNITRSNNTVGRFADASGAEKRWQGNIDYTYRPIKKWQELYLRAGGYLEDKKKDYSMSTLSYRDIPVLGFSKEPWTTIGDSLVIAQQLPGGKPMHTVNQDSGTGEYQTNGYVATFKNAAAYLAANIPIKFNSPFGAGKPMQLDIYGGMRFEYSERRVLTTKGTELKELTGTDANGKKVLVTKAANPYQKFYLPSVTANLHLTPKHQVRLAYGKTLNRPDLRELSPFVTYNPSDGFTYQGNHVLHDARIDNYDLRWEYYPTDEETISAGFYYKDIKEPIEEIQKNLNTGVPGFGPSNLIFAKIKGAEIEVRKKLGFIGGGIFKDLGVIVNASYNFTQTNNNSQPNSSGRVNYYPGGTTRPFMGAAPWIVNAGLFYDNQRSGSRISVQYNGIADRLLFNIGDNVTQDPWVFERGRDLIDASITQRLTKWVSVKVSAQNLLNAPIRWFADGDFNKRFNLEPTQFIHAYYNAPGDPITENKYIQGDYYVRNYKPGVYYSVGFQFNLNSFVKK